MYWKQKNKAAREHLKDALDSVDYSAVLQLAKRLGLKPQSRKKTDALALIAPFFADAEKLRGLYEMLAERQRQAVEDWYDLGALREFLQVREKETVRLYECRTAEIAAEIAAHPQTQKLCQRAGEKSLIGTLETEPKFRAALRQAGYGVGVE